MGVERIARNLGKSETRLVLVLCVVLFAGCYRNQLTSAYSLTRDVMSSRGDVEPRKRLLCNAKKLCLISYYQQHVCVRAMYVMVTLV